MHKQPLRKGARTFATTKNLFEETPGIGVSLIFPLLLGGEQDIFCPWAPWCLYVKTVRYNIILCMHMYICLCKNMYTAHICIQDTHTYKMLCPAQLCLAFVFIFFSQRNQPCNGTHRSKITVVINFDCSWQHYIPISVRLCALLHCNTLIHGSHHLSFHCTLLSTWACVVQGHHRYKLSGKS